MAASRSETFRASCTRDIEPSGCTFMVVDVSILANASTNVNMCTWRFGMARKQLGLRDGDVCCASVLVAPLSEAEAVDLARVFSALADPVRLRLLSLIADA